MIVKIAWRNIWRNKRRSAIVLVSMVVGIIMLVLQDGLSNGMITQMLNNQIKMGVGHIQIHNAGFNDNKAIKNYISDPAEIESLLTNYTHSKRVLAQGLISSAYNSAGLMVCGIQPDLEPKLTNIKESIIEGNYITEKEVPVREGSRFNTKQIVIGKKLAEKLSVKIGNKLSIMTNAPDGSRVSDLFRVAGIFKTASSQFDKSIVFIHIENAQQLLHLGNGVHEFSLLLANIDNTDKVSKSLADAAGPKYEVLNFKQILPLLLMQVDMYGQMLVIINMIIGLALIFGIINVMLMSVFERIPEIGVLMSVGMRNFKIFMMIVAEAFILGCIGTLAGLIFGYLVYLPFAKMGINLSIFEQSLDSFGVGAIIYPVLSLENLISVLFMMPFIAILGAIYPAIKAIKFEPVYAIRHI
jgi:ABC-type lipoprotein release transport system permease subunit